MVLSGKEKVHVSQKDVLGLPRASGLQAMPPPSPDLLYVMFTVPSQAEAAMEKSRARLVRDAVLTMKWLFLLFCVFAIGPSAVYPERNGRCEENGMAFGIDFEGGMLEGQARPTSPIGGNLGLSTVWG